MLLVVVLVGFAGTPITVTPSAQGASAEQMLLQLERDWEQAGAKNDQAALDRILAPEFVGTDSDGVLLTKAQQDSARKAGTRRATTFTQEDYKVHVFGDAAVVTGRSTLVGVRDGKPINERSRWTDFFVRRNGRWQAVASQTTRIAKSET